MYIHSVRLLNYKSIGNYEEAEIIIEPKITAIIGKNESGKTNVLEGLSEIDFANIKASAFASEKINRATPEGSRIQYEIVLKPSETEVGIGIDGSSLIIISEDDYNVSGGLFAYYCNTVKKYIDNLNAIIQQFDSNPFKLRDQALANYRTTISILANSTKLNIPKILEAISYFRTRQNSVPTDNKADFISALAEAEDKMREFVLILPSFFYRRTDKNLKTMYKIDEVEKELNSPSSTDLLFDLVKIIGVSSDEFMYAVRAGSAPKQITLRKRINRLIEEKINMPFQQFYATEKVFLSMDFNTSVVSFSVQSDDGAALMLNERSNGLRWYLETFIDAQAHNVSEQNVVYLLDEPGASLHVNAQKELLKMFEHLTNQGNQIVYTTHSPYMINTENEGLHHIRAVVKNSDGYTKIYKTAYDSRIAPSSQKDTLAPIINALGMNLNDTFGPAKDKLNIVTEGMSDYIYFCMMAKVLNIDSDKYAIIPSVGASNCVNICSILHGWGCKYIAVFDYDKAGVETGGEYLRKKMLFELGKQYCYLSNISQRDIEEKTYNDECQRCVIENMITEQEINRFCSDKNVSRGLGKSLLAKLMSNAVDDGTYQLGEDCRNNFKNLFNRIL